ncbi:hypothetical protein B9479_001623, partial [Cryptococcus floricola]
MPDRTDELVAELRYLFVKNRLNAEHTMHLLRMANPRWDFGSRRAFFNFFKRHNIDGPRKGALRGEELENALRSLHDIHGERGYRGRTHALVIDDHIVTRNRVQRHLHETEPEAAAGRKPKSKKIRRFPIRSFGPNQQWSMDGYDKMSALGLAIYGIRDVYSGYIIAAEVMPSNRLTRNVQYVFVKAVAARGGYPYQIASDSGREMGLASAVQQMLRVIHPIPDQFQDFEHHVQLESKHNITIERLWKTMREDLTDKVNRGLAGASTRGFNLLHRVHRVTFHWLMVPVIQGSLAEFHRFHMSFKVRHQVEKFNPSGCSRQDAYRFPQFFGDMECLTPVDPMGAWNLYRMAEAEATLRWWTPEQGEVLEDGQRT